MRGPPAGPPRRVAVHASAGDGASVSSLPGYKTYLGRVGLPLLPATHHRPRRSSRHRDRRRLRLRFRQANRRFSPPLLPGVPPRAQRRGDPPLIRGVPSQLRRPFSCGPEPCRLWSQATRVSTKVIFSRNTVPSSQEEFDTYDHNAHLFVKLQFLKKRSKIIEIVAAKDIIFALAHSGLCAAFSRVTNKRISFLNLSPDEVIRSLFYNKNNDSLITVSVYASDHFSTLKCRTTPIEYIRRNQLDAGFPLFETESLKWPGFVEFDDVNGKVLTYSAQDGIYKVFDLKNYSFLYSIPDTNVQEIKISPGIMLLIYDRTPSYVPLKILSIEDGKPLKSFKHLLHRNKKIDFIEQFNEKLLVKQEDENLQILDVRSSELIEVSINKFMTPSAFIFLYENNLFLTFRNRTVAVWNFRGELVTSFEDHLLWHQDCSTNNIYITSDQDLIISYCKSEVVVDDSTAPPIGSINMSDIMTGKCIAKIAANDPVLSVAPRMNGSPVWSTIPEALEDVTALFYDEDRNEIYTGNSQGLVHVWSS